MDLFDQKKILGVWSLQEVQIHGRRQSDRKTKTLKTDGRDEYVLNGFGKFYDQEEISQEKVPPYTPQQNRVI